MNEVHIIIESDTRVILGVYSEHADAAIALCGLCVTEEVPPAYRDLELLTFKVRSFAPVKLNFA
jgi:hypothetical protein